MQLLPNCLSLNSHVSYTCATLGNILVHFLHVSYQVRARELHIFHVLQAGVADRVGVVGAIGSDVGPVAKYSQKVKRVDPFSP